MFNPNAAYLVFGTWVVWGHKPAGWLALVLAFAGAIYDTYITARKK